MLRRSVAALLLAAFASTSACNRAPTVSTTSLPDGMVGLGQDVQRWIVAHDTLQFGVQLSDDGRVRGMPTLAGHLHRRRPEGWEIDLGEMSSVVSPTNSVDQSLSNMIRP